MTSSAPAPALSIRGLAKAFRDPEGTPLPVLDVPSLDLDRGEHLAVVGESGAGKTTLLHVIAGILPADEGEVRVLGEPMTGRGERARDRLRARHIGYVFQTFNLLDHLTALENVQLALAFVPGGGDARRRAREALERVGLGDRTGHRPGQLSTGQRQRVAIARALVGDPALVLADEPTANLDAANAATCLDLLVDFAREREAALLVVTHQPEVIARFDRRHDLATPTPEVVT